MYGNKFPNSSMMSDFNCSVFSGKFQILWNSGNNCTWKNFTMSTDSCTRHNSHIGADPGSLSYINILVDYREGIYLHIFTNLCARVNDSIRIVHKAFGIADRMNQRFLYVLA